MRREKEVEEEGKCGAIQKALNRLRGGREPWLQVWQPWTGNLSSAFKIKELPPLHPPFCTNNDPLGPDFKILASAGGLVCGHIQKSELGYVALAVGNPLTCKWKKLPRPVPDPPHRPFSCNRLDAHMWVDSGSHHYKVALSTQDWCVSPKYLWEPSWLLIYTSEDDSWKQAPEFDWPATFQHGHRTSRPSVKVPLFLHRPPTPPNQYTFGLAAYDTASRSWAALAEAQLPPEFYDWGFLSLRIFPYKDMYLMIAIGVDYDRHSLLSNCWTLDELSNSFRKKSSFSVSLGIRYTSFLGGWWDELEKRPYRFMLEGNVVVICPHDDAELWPVLAYNMELSTWAMMQDNCRPQFAFETLCALSPSLLAAP